MTDLKKSKSILHTLYKEIDGFFIPKSEEKLIRETKSSPLYGEITFASVQKLFDRLNPNATTHFYDLGCGTGKVVIQAAMNFPMHSYVGVELSKARITAARGVKEKAEELGVIRRGVVEFRHENILDIKIADASLVYACSTAFSATFMKIFANFIVSHAHRLTLVSLQELPRHPHYYLAGEMRLDMTWQRKSPVYIYEVN